MLKFKKKLSIFLICISFLHIFSLSTLAIVKPTYEYYVNDYANVLSEDTKQFIVKSSRELAVATKAKIVVITIPSLEDVKLKDYAIEAYNSFIDDSKSSNNGILILLVTETHECQIEVGTELTFVLSDSKINEIQKEYMTKYFKKDNFNKGISKGYTALLNIVSDKYNVQIGDFVLSTKDKINLILIKNFRRANSI